MSKEVEARAPGAAALDQVRQSVYSDLQYVSLQVEGKPYGGWYRLLPDGRMELLALANMHCERRPEETPVEQARGMLADFIRASRSDGRPHPEPQSAPKTNGAHGESGSTVGSLLYADAAKPRVSEDEWICIVKAIAAGDQRALDNLYERTHRIVYTLLVRLIGDPEIAEEATLDVFHDVWRQASQYDPAGGPVLSWLLGQTQLRAFERRELDRRKRTELLDPKAHTLRLRNAVNAITPSERQIIEAAYFSKVKCEQAAAERQEPVEAIKERVHSALEKLRETLSPEAER